MIDSPARGGDMSAQWFEESYGRSVDMLYRICFSYLKNPADAEDAVSDVFVKLLRHGDRFQSGEHEKPWLIRTAINTCKDYLKHWWHRRAPLEDYGDIVAADFFQEDETLKIVLELPERYKAAVYLYYYEGYTSAEIAVMLKKPQSTILNHLSEARKLLREVLEDGE